MDRYGRAARAVGGHLGEEVDRAQIAAFALQPGDRIVALADAAVAGDDGARLVDVGESLRAV